MKLTIKSIVLAASLALPTFFAGNAFAQAAPSTCGANCTSASANPHGYTAAMGSVNCYSCHSKPVVVTPPPVVTPPKPPVVVPPVVTPPVTGTVTPHATSKSCGACVKGTAPSSVSAHKNVNSTMTACSACHGASSGGGSTGGTGGSTGGTGGSTGGTTGGTTSGHHSDDNHSTTGGSTSSHSDHHGSSGKKHGHDD
jgi:hypothetical protein